MDTTHFHVLAFRKSGGYDAKRFEGEAITARSDATHYADQIASFYDVVQVRDAVGTLVYMVRDPHGKIIQKKGGMTHA